MAQPWWMARENERKKELARIEKATTRYALFMWQAVGYYREQDRVRGTHLYKSQVAAQNAANKRNTEGQGMIVVRPVTIALHDIQPLVPTHNR